MCVFDGDKNMAETQIKTTKRLSKYPVIECMEQFFSDEEPHLQRYHPLRTELESALKRLDTAGRTNIRVVYEYEEVGE